MTDKVENPTAFPVQDCAAYQCHGMSLRDWFAGQALGGLLADNENRIVFAKVVNASPHRKGDERSLAASVAYRYADAMLAERMKGSDHD